MQNITIKHKTLAIMEVTSQMEVDEQELSEIKSLCETQFTNQELMQKIIYNAVKYNDVTDFNPIDEGVKLSPSSFNGAYDFSLFLNDKLIAQTPSKNHFEAYIGINDDKVTISFGHETEHSDNPNLYQVTLTDLIEQLMEFHTPYDAEVDQSNFNEVKRTRDALQQCADTLHAFINKT